MSVCRHVEHVTSRATKTIDSLLLLVRKCSDRPALLWRSPCLPSSAFVWERLTWIGLVVFRYIPPRLQPTQRATEIASAWVTWRLSHAGDTEPRLARFSYLVRTRRRHIPGSRLMTALGPRIGERECQESLPSHLHAWRPDSRTDSEK